MTLLTCLPVGPSRHVHTVHSFSEEKRPHQWRRAMQAGKVNLRYEEVLTGCNNVLQAKKSVKEIGKQLFTCAPLKGFIRSDGQHSVMHGGTAILAPPELSFDFDPASDQTGLYSKLYSSHRANACWAQVTPTVRALIFSIYAKTSASSNPQIFGYNDALFADIFTICAQFGSIPIILAGDFQSPPLHYPSISNAVNFHNWFDPLTTLDDLGESIRPLTYSKDSTFSGHGDFCSSIDGILVNQVASCAMQSIQVVQTSDSQHRPVRATFSWPTIWQHGFIHQKFAPIVTESLDKPGLDPTHPSNEVADFLWNSRFARLYAHHTNPDQQWNTLNDFCSQTLLSSGAHWGHGPRKRRALPLFQYKQFCPGQAKSGSALSLRASWLQNALSRLDELFVRLQRPASSIADLHILQRTSKKVCRSLHGLKCPHVWRIPTEPSLLEVALCRKWVQVQLQNWDFCKKQQRINAWRSQIKHSATSTKKYIYHHLKTKSIDEPVNLVTDSSGNILYQPSEALHHVNQQWDTIFASNALHEDPLRVLHFVWPYIQHTATPIVLPELTAADLAMTIGARNPLASPGMDGWRTTELQLLPRKCLEQIAVFFNQLETDCGGSIPDVLLRAKQALLNKPGPASPLNKRLITALSPLLLAYSGTRFRQLQQWQQTTLHPSLFGGIKGRSMAAVSDGLRLDIDAAKVDDQPLTGIKLDQSKCFDRIVPPITAALMLALGLPKGVVNMFSMMYRGLKKHLSYRNWISHVPVTNANGVAQGCSLSLLAINVHMHVWACFVDRFHDITCRVFIDDAYFWVSVTNLHLLQQALRTTELWGLMVGQHLNHQKSVLWATSANARILAKEAFPQLPLSLEFDVLGAKIYTSERNAFLFDPAKCSKVISDIKNISNLPVSIKVKTDLLGAKVLPQISFATQISKIPKRSLERIQNELVSVYWGSRPHWRSKMLVFALLSIPHRVEPVCVRAYNCILNFWRCIHSQPSRVAQCCHMLASPELPKHSLLLQVQQALSLFHLSLSPKLELVFCDIAFPPLEVGVRELRRLLQVLAVQYCYERAADQKRKDIYKPKGFIDPFLTATFRRQYVATKDETNLLPYFDSQIVGCTLTNDRLCAANLIESNLCRFCHVKPESMPHWIFECVDALPLAQPPCHEFGENFAMLGICEHPIGICKHRLQFTSIHDDVCAVHNPYAPRASLWTDGSVFYPESFWLTTAGCSVANEQGACIHAERVCCPVLTSYTAELFAVYRACLHATCNIDIFSDCKSVVDQFNILIAQRCVDPSWTNSCWWRAILQIYCSRDMNECQPVRLFWIPSHVGDDVPDFLISPAFAAEHGTTVQHILCNRKADLAAKKIAAASLPVEVQMYTQMKQAIFARQHFLARLNELSTPEVPATAVVEEIPVCEDATSLRRKFGRWNWNQNLADFPWRFEHVLDISTPWFSQHSSNDITTFIRFARALAWKVGDAFCTSYMELAFLFQKRGYTLEACCGDDITFRDLSFWLRRIFVHIGKIPDHQVFPGYTCLQTRKSEGRSFPQGAIVGAVPFFSPAELHGLAQMMDAGCSKLLSSWEIPLTGSG